MFEKLKKELNLKKINLLEQKGFKEGKIVPFDADFYKQLSTTFISYIPVSIHIKYLRPNFTPGKCYDRSLYMFFCFDDAVLVRGKNRKLELMYDKESAGHGWIERGNYVYDPSSLLRFEKDLYYKIYAPKNISKYTLEEYCSSDSNKKIYDSIKNTTIEDYYPNGSKRVELINVIPLLKEIAFYSENDQFKKDLDEWVKTIKYDELQICKELDEKLKKVL